MTNTTNYNLNIVEGTDIVNPLTQFNPNFNTIDGVMKNNADAAVSPATCIKTGTVHTVTRTNTGAEMFIFTATGDWNSGDTMTVDGTPVTPVLPDGTALLAGSYLINAEVLASIKGSKVTIYSNKNDLATINAAITSLQSDVSDLETPVNYSTADNKVHLRVVGKTVDVYLTANTAGAITIDGIQLPNGIKPNRNVHFVGKAGDNWIQPYRIDNNGLLTARSGNDVNPVAVDWAIAHTTFVM